MRTVIDIDDIALESAARQLGTRTKVDTVNAALAYVAGIPERTRLILESDHLFGGPDLLDSDVRAQARR